MPHPCDRCRFEGFCIHENNICRQAFFAVAEGAEFKECPEKVWQFYRGQEGVFA